MHSSHALRCSRQTRSTAWAPCRRSVVAAGAEFSFAETKPKLTGRRNRVVEKRHEQQLRTVAHGLCGFNAKQLAAVSHLLSQEHLREVRIGMDIPPTNQGRKRQAGLVMKLLRDDLDEATLGKLSEAVAQAAANKQPYTDGDVEQQLALWVEGLLADDEEVVSEVYTLLQDNQQDWQQFRQWVRQLQQADTQQEGAHASSSSSCDALVSTSSGGSQPATEQQAVLSEAVLPVSDPEVLQLMQELSAQQQQQRRRPAGKQRAKAGRPSGSGGVSSATAARRAIRKMLRPHAVAMQQ